MYMLKGRIFRFLYIETDLKDPPLKMSGFYDYQVVRGALENSHDKIKYYIPGGYQPNNDRKLENGLISIGSCC